MTVAAFVAAIVAVPCAVGLPVGFHRTLRRLSLVARVSLAWTAGSLAVAVLLTLSSALGLPWSPWPVVCIACLALATTVLATRRMTAEPTTRRQAHGIVPLVVLATMLCIAVAGLVSFATGSATSADLCYFWGVKAVHFALERGIDVDLLRQPFMIHLHPNYPPLWPVLLGWGVMIAGSLPWLAVPSLTWMCLGVAAAIIFSFLEIRLGAPAAAIVTCLWYGVLSSMATWSFSGGNADGPLVLFLSVALVVILTETASGSRQLRWVAAMALAGAVFTKSEGGIVVALIMGGAMVRDWIWRRSGVVRESILLIAPAAAALTFWAVVRVAHDLPLSDPIREKIFEISFEQIGLILSTCSRLLVGGAAAVGWLVPLVSLLVVGWKPLTRALPGVVVACGIPCFAVIYYLHAVGDPLELIVWTFPRLMQPAMSAWILGLGVVVFSADGEKTRGQRDHEALA